MTRIAAHVAAEGCSELGGKVDGVQHRCCLRIIDEVDVDEVTVLEW